MIWCLHGNIGHPSDWDVLNEAQSPFAGQTLRKVDLWRYLECRSVSLVEFGEIFASEVAAQDPEPVLVGYSLGGRLALHALLARPELWKSAYLVSVHPGLRTEQERVERREHDAEWSAKALSSKWSLFLKEWNAQSVLGEVPGRMADRHLLQPRQLGIARGFTAWSLGTQEDLREAVAEVTCPVTLVTGERDHKYTQLGREFKFPNVEYEVIPKAGHRPLWERPMSEHTWR